MIFRWFCDFSPPAGSPAVAYRPIPTKLIGHPLCLHCSPRWRLINNTHDHHCFYPNPEYPKGACWLMNEYAQCFIYWRAHTHMNTHTYITHTHTDTHTRARTNTHAHTWDHTSNININQFGRALSLQIDSVCHILSLFFIHKCSAHHVPPYAIPRALYKLQKKTKKRLETITNHKTENPPNSTYPWTITSSPP